MATQLIDTTFEDGQTFFHFENDTCKFTRIERHANKAYHIGRNDWRQVYPLLEGQDYDAPEGTEFWLEMTPRLSQTDSLWTIRAARVKPGTKKTIQLAYSPDEIGVVDSNEMYVWEDWRFYNVNEW